MLFLLNLFTFVKIGKMKEKLEYLMNQTGLRVGQIAAMVGVKPPVISHLLVGRNMPNFKLTAKIIEVFSDYSPLWWLGLSDDPNATFTTVKCPTTPEQMEEKKSSAPTSSKVVDQTLFEMIDTSTTSTERTATTHASSEIERVIVIYSDKSFESFTPKK